VKAPFHIGHLAISLASLLSSGIQVVGSGSVPQDAWPAIARWRTESAAGRASAFSEEIHKAIEFTRQIVMGRNQTGNDAFVESAYPERSAKGDLTSIKVIYSTKASR
jgi:hypothetical protein